LRQILVIIFIIGLLFMGCGTDEKTASIIRPEKTDINSLDKDVQELLSRNDNFIEPDPTPFEKIGKALDDKMITEEESVMLTFLAAFDPDNLPKEYSGVIPSGMSDGALNEAEWWLTDNWDSLPDASKEKFEPFYVVPDDPKSFFNPDNKDKTTAMLKKLEIIPGVKAETGRQAIEAIISTSPNRKVVIVYEDNTAQKQKALWVNESIHKAWPMYKDLFGVEPTEATYLYITDLGNGFYGSAIMRNLAGARRCYVKVTKAEDKKIVQSTAAHELFHCFQYYIPLEYSKVPRMWMLEATATWSEHWVYPDYNVEWRVLDGSFSLLHEDLIQWNRYKEYTRYIWYLFQTQYYGGISKVKSDLFAVKDIDARKVVTSASGFDDAFAEYALWNWNQNPEERYQDAPVFPTGTYKGKPMRPVGKAYKSKLVNTKTELSQEVDLEPLSMAYRAYAFTDNIDKVVFKFEKESDQKHRRQALIKIGDIWHWEDWTEIKERKFCRTRDDEKVLAVVLIYSNSDPDMADFYKDKYKVDSREKCNPEWRGTTRWSFSYSTGWQVLYANHRLSTSGHMLSNDVLVYDEDEDEFYVKDQFITYNSQNYHLIDFNHDCGMIYENSLSQSSGSSHNTWEIDEKNPSESKAPVRLSVDYDDPIMYDVKIDVVDSSKDWITVMASDAVSKKVCPIEGVFTPSSGTYAKEDVSYRKTSDFASKPNPIKAKMSLDGKSIKGSTTQTMGAFGEEFSVLIEVDYRYG